MRLSVSSVCPELINCMSRLANEVENSVTWNNEFNEVAGAEWELWKCRLDRYYWTDCCCWSEQGSFSLFRGCRGAHSQSNGWLLWVCWKENMWLAANKGVGKDQRRERWKLERNELWSVIGFRKWCRWIGLIRFSWGRGRMGRRGILLDCRETIWIRMTFIQYTYLTTCFFLFLGFIAGSVKSSKDGELLESF